MPISLNLALKMFARVRQLAGQGNSLCLTLKSGRSGFEINAKEDDTVVVVLF